MLVAALDPIPENVGALNGPEAAPEPNTGAPNPENAGAFAVLAAAPDPDAPPNPPNPPVAPVCKEGKAAAVLPPEMTSF